MKTIVFATNNAHKLAEVRALITDKIHLASLADIGCLDELPETSGTLEGNALQKARYVNEHFACDCFADDTGLEVDALNGAPGVLSARYAGPTHDAQANLDKLLRHLDGTPNRQARFRTVIALILDGQQYLFHGIVDGRILHHRRGISGFGYDPIFVPRGFDRTFAEISLETKNRISHRAVAVRQLVDQLLRTTTDNPKHQP
jgi:XTP/dITP diphosphohydrolase